MNNLEEVKVVDQRGDEYDFSIGDVPPQFGDPEAVSFTVFRRRLGNKQRREIFNARLAPDAYGRLLSELVNREKRGQA